MSDEEHLVVNIVSAVQYLGWQNVPDPEEDPQDFDKMYHNLSENGNRKISRETFIWLLEMARYVVYQSTVCCSDLFANMESQSDV